MQQSAREDEYEQQRQQRREAERERRDARPPGVDKGKLEKFHWSHKRSVKSLQYQPGRRNEAVRQQERELRAEVVKLTRSKEDTLSGISPLLKGASASPATGAQLIVADEDGETDAFEGFERIESGDEEPVPAEVEEELLRDTSTKP